MKITDVKEIENAQSGTRMLDAALNYYARGYSVIPIHAPGTKLPPQGRTGDEGKVPLSKWTEFQKRLPTEDEIRRWWTTWPHANIGIVTGAVSGIIVLDVDGEVGRETLTRYEEPDDTVAVVTGGDGLHYYFQHPGYGVGNSVNKVPGIDVRGDGGYVVAPPSMHASGQRYEFSRSPAKYEFAPPPDWLLRIATPQPLGNARNDVAQNGCAGSSQCERILEGERNTTLYRLSRSMRKKGLTEEATSAALVIQNRLCCSPPLDSGEVKRIVTSAYRQPDRADFLNDQAQSMDELILRRFSL